MQSFPQHAKVATKGHGTILPTSLNQSGSFQGASARRALQALPGGEKRLRSDPSCLHCAS